MIPSLDLETISSPDGKFWTISFELLNGDKIRWIRFTDEKVRDFAYSSVLLPFLANPQQGFLDLDLWIDKNFPSYERFKML